MVFDLEAFVDRATFEDPQQYPPGVRWLFLAGQPAITDGQVAEAICRLDATTGSAAARRKRDTLSQDIYRVLD